MTKKNDIIKTQNAIDTLLSQKIVLTVDLYSGQHSIAFYADGDGKNMTDRLDLTLEEAKTAIADRLAKIDLDIASIKQQAGIDL